MSRWIREHSLSLTLFGAFLVFIALQSLFGWQVRNEELAQYGQDADSYLRYLTTGHFSEAVFENWESEFLQMGAYVWLTAFLVQKGSAESKAIEESDRPEDLPENAGPDSPTASRGHGAAQKLYRNSLTLALLGFFLLSMAGHLIGGTAEYNEQQMLESGEPPISAWQFLGTSDFWFQSMQNWQSEFLAVGALVVLSIYLRQHGSPESKPVTAPHAAND
jgi:hypothetical protein